MSNSLAKKLLARFAANHGLKEVMIATASALMFKVGGAIFSFLLGLIIARKFGAQGSGTFALANTLNTMGVTLCLLGLDYMSVQRVAATRATEHWSELRSWVKTANALALFAAVMVSTILWFGSNEIAATLRGGAALSTAIAILGLAIVPTTASKLLSAQLRGMGEASQANLIDPFLIPAIAVLLLIWPFHNLADIITRFFIAASLCAFLAALLWFRTERRINRVKAELIPWSVLKTSMPIYLTVVSSFAVPWITMLVVGAAGSERDAGIYRVAQQFGFILSLVPQAIEIAMSPKFAALHATGNLHDVAKTCRHMTFTVALVAGIPALLLFMFADQVMGVFGPEFRDGALTLRILTVGQMVAMLCGPVGSVMVMTGLERLSLLNAFAGALVVLIASVFFIPRYGIVGAALASTLTVSFRLVVATAIVWTYRGLFLPLGLTRA